MGIKEVFRKIVNALNTDELLKELGQNRYPVDFPKSNYELLKGLAESGYPVDSKTLQSSYPPAQKQRIKANGLNFSIFSN